MSFSGSLLILTLLFGKSFIKNKISRQWQYYIWLVVILRLLLPFRLEVNLLGKLYQLVDQTITQTTPLPQQQSTPNIPRENLTSAIVIESDNENVNNPIQNSSTVHSLQDIWILLIHQMWLIWLITALGLIIRKITIYQSFIQYIKASLTPISDIRILDQLSIIAKQAGIIKPIELCVNPLVSSPLLIGFFHPCIVLPSIDISEKDFQYIVLHELTHYKRGDMFYKWLVQVTVCLHWFNPLVHFMSHEITKACEFSCDEAVLIQIGCDNAQNYGKTLLDAMAAVGKYKENLGAITLHENKQLFKERLGAIMNFKRKSKTMQLLTGVLTLCIILGTAFIGVYSTAAASNQPSSNSLVSGNQISTPEETNTHTTDYASLVEWYYMADSLPLFEITFSQLDKSSQKKWLEKLYADDNIAFFSVATHGLDIDSSLFADFAEKAYIDEEIAFFSCLADSMNETQLKSWLDRALKDDRWDFQSMLFNRLDQDNDFDSLQDRKWAEAQTEKYQAVGVTMNGKDYYYQEQLVNIFLDLRSNKSFCTLNMNPKGRINIKIIRNENDEITGVAYMTDAEVAKLLEEPFGDSKKDALE